jgi:hypothetical protein
MFSKTLKIVLLENESKRLENERKRLENESKIVIVFKI